ncbi:PREDICTED: probable glycerol-3-phosphate acyltransferase 3 [Nelumbo nucifera]|uniref:Probable glycerol-3-phosphate acyltransferase 3 n=1 Tax=Nelumbo nucifera TaxID=4432 RepID=A0A1U8A0L6_NELNU|nr:PREDICTED: probable glycerol-3-phosphate acyltransferase 3 [Nelumbo nucifera]
MAGKASLRDLFFFSRIVLRRLRNPRSLWRKGGNSQTTQFKFQKYISLSCKPQLSSQTLIFDVEGLLLRSPSLFPYFMLVAFEGGGLLRSLILFLLYPFVCMVSQEMGLKIMVFVCFFGIKAESFRVGRAVLPKYLLNDVGLEGFEALMKFQRNVGVSALPRVMIEGFLRDYLGIEFAVGRELVVFRGYFLGLMEDKEKTSLVLEKMLGEDKPSSHVVGIAGSNKHLHHLLFSQCKEIYWVNEAEKRSWSHLPKENYPKPLIFHDGRLAFRPTPQATLAAFMWFPMGLLLAIIRTVAGLLLPYNISGPILALTGMRRRQTKPKSSPTTVSVIPTRKAKGTLYVCNHRTLLDPVYLSAALNKPLTAVTYSLSRVSELLSPIKTVRLTRDRERDAETMKKMLGRGDLVVCPEGTTCREPYLLRFSPLFAEMSDEIVPVAMDVEVSMFYGTTAAGLKCLDPLFFLMNPFPTYKVRLLDKVSGSSTCCDGGPSRFDVANHVQRRIGQALGFQCTKLTRKDKYLILAGNEGMVAAVGNINKPIHQRSDLVCSHES